MIGYLKGKIIQTSGPMMILDVAGVGYEVLVGESEHGFMLDETAEVWVHTYVREDQLVLFGFREPLQKKIFLILMGISGIGPKLAQAATTLLAPEALVNAITFGDTAVLRTIPGVGKKVADRMVLELKDKLGLLVHSGIQVSAAPGAQASLAVWHDLQVALSGLGFADAQVRNVVKLIRPEFEGKEPEINQVLKLALQRIRNC